MTTPDTTPDTHGAFVEALSAFLGPMLEPAERERLVVMARLADAVGPLRAAMADLVATLDRYALEYSRGGGAFTVYFTVPAGDPAVAAARRALEALP